MFQITFVAIILAVMFFILLRVIFVLVNEYPIKIEFTARTNFFGLLFNAIELWILIEVYCKLY